MKICKKPCINITPMSKSTKLNARFVFFNSNRRKVALICRKRKRRRKRMMTKTTSMKADLGGGEGIAIRHQLLSSNIGGVFFLFPPHADKINATEITFFFFFPLQYFQTK